MRQVPASEMPAPMPKLPATQIQPEPGFGAVLGHQGVNEPAFFYLKKSGHLGSEGKQELRNLRRRAEHVGFEVVARAVGRDAAPGGEALVVRFLERQPADLGEEV